MTLAVAQARKQAAAPGNFTVMLPPVKPTDGDLRPGLRAGGSQNVTTPNPIAKATK